MQRAGRRSRNDVSFVLWCDACCGPRAVADSTPGIGPILLPTRGGGAHQIESIRFWSGSEIEPATRPWGAVPSDTLRVAVDPFSDAETRYRDLVEQRRTGSLQARAFRLAVRDLAVLDGEGGRWMLGPEDGIWYRRERERWLQADPPRRLVCPSCGHHNLGRHSFCVECGQRLSR